MARGQKFILKNTGKYNIVFFQLDLAVNNVTFWSFSEKFPDCISLILLSKYSNFTPDEDCVYGYNEALQVDFPENFKPLPKFLGSLAAPFFGAHSQKEEKSKTKGK